MAKSNENITFKGSPIKVSGHIIKEGDIVPDFTVTGNDLKDFGIKEFKNKVVIISVVPSLDTPVCATQTKRFNQDASKLSTELVVLTISRDLPFAQKRWCGAEGVDRVITASDYKLRTFGQAFGTAVDDLGLLCRAVFVVDKAGKIVHAEYVPEITEEPNYEAALNKAKAAL